MNKNNKIKSKQIKVPKQTMKSLRKQYNKSELSTEDVTISKPVKLFTEYLTSLLET